jgi:uracil-DNA glycosylase family 4
MSLVLDTRQRAMLEEMGVKLFWPDAVAVAEPEPVFAAGPAFVQEIAEAVRMPAPVAAPVVQPPPRVSTVRAPAPIARAGLVADPAARVRVPGIELMEWDALRQAVAECGACNLCEGRANTVFGVGDLQADWLVVGESPDEHEDQQGEPFVGQAGKLLDNMLAAMGLGRTERVYIANVLKCRPPGNRNPEPDEVAQCEPFLRRQVELLQPKIILAMGRFAVQTLLQTSEPIGRLRGRAHSYNGVPVIVTYHPAYLLRNLADKGKAWADLVLAQALMKERS